MSARRAQREPHGQLAPAAVRTHEQQIHDVGARDQQHTDHAAGENDEDRFRLAHDVRLKRRDREIESRGGQRGLTAPLALRETRHLLDRLGLVRGGRQPPNKLQLAGRQAFARPHVAVLPPAVGYLPEVHVARPRWQVQLERRRQDTDDGVREAVENDRAADDLWIRVEQPPPGVVAEHHRAGWLMIHEPAAQSRVDAEQ